MVSPKRKNWNITPPIDILQNHWRKRLLWNKRQHSIKPRARVELKINSLVFTQIQQTNLNFYMKQASLYYLYYSKKLSVIYIIQTNLFHWGRYYIYITFRATIIIHYNMNIFCKISNPLAVNFETKNLESYLYYSFIKTKI